MEKVSKEFVDALPRKSPAGRNSEIMNLAMSLEIEESMWIGKEEWAQSNHKTKPTQLVISSSYQPRAQIFGRRYSTRTLENGWLITRTK